MAHLNIYIKLSNRERTIRLYSIRISIEKNIKQKEERSKSHVKNCPEMIHISLIH